MDVHWTSNRAKPFTLKGGAFFVVNQKRAFYVRYAYWPVWEG